MHGGQNLGVLPHAQIVVGTPDGDFASARPMVGGTRELARFALQVGEDPVAAFIAQQVEFGLEEKFVIHLVLSGGLSAATCHSVRSHGVRFVFRVV